MSCRNSFNLFRDRIEKKINNLKIELNYSSLQNLIKTKMSKDDFDDEFSKLNIKITNIKINMSKYSKEIQQVSDWIMTLSKATSDVEKGKTQSYWHPFIFKN